MTGLGADSRRSGVFGRALMLLGAVLALFAVPARADAPATAVKAGPAAASPITAKPVVTAAVPADALARPGRPRIGLVLGGGGAKGFAHIGVIAELERMRIPIDAVAGTSMGAVVGSIYAGGHNSTELLTVAHNIDWVTLFDDSIPRDELSFRR